MRTPLILGLLIASTHVNATQWKTNTSLSLTSQYVVRGVVLNEAASLQGQFELNHSSGLYFGTKGASDQTLGAEVNLYGGYAYTLARGVILDVGIMQYRYDEPEVDVQHEEWHVALQTAWGQVKVNAGEEDQRYYEYQYTYETSTPTAVHVHVGYVDDDTQAEPLDYGVGISYQLGRYYTLTANASQRQAQDPVYWFGLTAAF